MRTSQGLEWQGYLCRSVFIKLGQTGIYRICACWKILDILGKRSKRHYFNSSPKGNLPIMVVIIVGDKYICWTCNFWWNGCSVSPKYRFILEDRRVKVNQRIIFCRRASQIWNEEQLLFYRSCQIVKSATPCQSCRCDKWCRTWHLVCIFSGVIIEMKLYPRRR